LREEARAVGGVHRDDLDGDAARGGGSANDTTTTDLAYGKVQQHLNERTKRQGLFCANKEAADG